MIPFRHREPSHDATRSGHDDSVALGKENTVLEFNSLLLLKYIPYKVDHINTSSSAS